MNEEAKEILDRLKENLEESKNKLFALENEMTQDICYLEKMPESLEKLKKELIDIGDKFVGKMYSGRLTLGNMTRIIDKARKE